MESIFTQANLTYNISGTYNLFLWFVKKKKKSLAEKENKGEKKKPEQIITCVGGLVCNTPTTGLQQHLVPLTFLLKLR